MNELLFSATIQWLDDGEIEDVVMATYDTEGTPEDEWVFFSFGGYDVDELIEELDNWKPDEWKMLAYDKNLLRKAG